MADNNNNNNTPDGSFCSPNVSPVLAVPTHSNTSSSNSSPSFTNGLTANGAAVALPNHGVNNGLAAFVSPADGAAAASLSTLHGSSAANQLSMAAHNGGFFNNPPPSSFMSPVSAMAPMPGGPHIYQYAPSHQPAPTLFPQLYGVDHTSNNPFQNILHGGGAPLQATTTNPIAPGAIANPPAPAARTRPRTRTTPRPRSSAPAVPGPGGRGRGFTGAEIDNMLAEIEERLPIGQTEWDLVTSELNKSSFPPRTTDAIRRKFNTLHKTRIPTGDPSIPADVRKAKSIRLALQGKAGIINGALLEAEELDVGVEDDEADPPNDADDNNNNTEGTLAPGAPAPTNVPVASSAPTTANPASSTVNHRNIIASLTSAEATLRAKKAAARRTLQQEAAPTTTKTPTEGMLEMMQLDMISAQRDKVKREAEWEEQKRLMLLDREEERKRREEERQEERRRREEEREYEMKKREEDREQEKARRDEERAARQAASEAQSQMMQMMMMQFAGTLNNGKSRANENN